MRDATTQRPTHDRGAAPGVTSGHLTGSPGAPAPTDGARGASSPAASAGATGLPTGRGEQGADGANGHPAIVVRGRHTEVPERFRVHAVGKLLRLDKLDHKLIRLDVEVSREHNPRLSAQMERVEITCIGRGPIVRAEASAQDAYAALDAASAKLEERLRRGADRRHSRGARVARLLPRTADVAGPDTSAEVYEDSAKRPNVEVRGTSPTDLIVEGDDDGPFVVREKVHVDAHMTLDEALARMELVGHDFYLFTDAECGHPSVVYRRRGYHYGVLRLRGDADQTIGATMTPDASG